MIQTVFLLLVDIVPLGGEHKGPSKLGISIEGMNACHNVTKIQIEGLPANYDLFSDESGTIRKVVVDELVKLCCILVQESQALANLWISMRWSTGWKCRVPHTPSMANSSENAVELGP
jgi:hypothetical protein